MGQLTASAFQAYNSSDAAGIQPGPFALYAVSLSDILPTQMNVGEAEVGSKISGWNLLAPSQVESTLLTDIEPVVIGPGGQVYLLNGHHTFTSLAESIYGASNPTVYVNVVANYSGLTTQEFWTQMETANLLLPLNDGVPQTVNTATGAPIPAELTELTDDPYRGLEHSILKNKSLVLFPTGTNLTGSAGASTPGLDKMNGFYADFIWADAYRNANNGLGLPYLSDGDIALATQWNLNPNSVTSMPGVGTVKVGRLPGFILNQNISVATQITNGVLSTGTLDAFGTFTGITSFNFGTLANPIIVGTPQSGFVMQMGHDAGFGVTLANATNNYTGGTTILAGTLTVSADGDLGAAAPSSYTIDPNNILADVEADNGIIFNSLDEGAGTLKLAGSFSTNRPIAVDGETATIDLNSNTLTLTGTIVSLGSNGDGLGDESGISDLTVVDSGTGGKLVLSPTTGTNAGFFGNWIISSGTLVVSSDASLGNTVGAPDTIGQIDLDGGTFQAGANFSSVRSLFLTGGSTYDTNGFTTSFSGSMTDVQRTLTVKNTNTTAAGAVTFGSFNADATAILALSGGTKGETVTFTNGIVRSDVATVMIDPSSNTSLGTTEKVFSTTAPTLTNGIVAPWIITDNGGSASSNPYSFLTYGANGFVRATYTKVGSGSSGGIRAAGATDIVEQTGNATLAANASAYALQVDSGATITATGFTITVGNGTGQAGLILSNGNITGGTLAFGAAEAVINAKGSSIGISSVLTGTNGLTLDGSGTVTISAAASMSGAINIDSGTLALTVANAFANASGVTLYNVKSSPSNAILNLAASQTFKSLNSTGTNSVVNLSAGASLTIGDSVNNFNSTLSSTINENGTAVTGALTKAGSGLLDVSGGKINLSAASTVCVTGGQLRVEAKEFTNANTITLSTGTELQFAENAGDIFAGNITGTGDVRLIGGTLKLTGTGSTYSGGTFVEAGSTLILTTGLVSTGNANIGAAGGDVEFDQTTNGTYSGVISDALEMGTGPQMQGTLIKDDSTGGNGGNVTLAAVQQFTGDTYIEAGTLTLGVANALANSSEVVLGRVGGGATANLVLNANNQLAALADDADNTTSVLLNGNTLTVAPGANTSASFNGTIADGSGPLGSLVKAGVGTETLSGANTFTGGVTLEGGTLELGNAHAAGTGAITFAGGTPATLEIDFGDVPANTISGFATGDSIDLAGIGFTNASGAVLTSGNILAVTENGATYDLQLDRSASYSGVTFNVAADSTGSGSVVTMSASSSPSIASAGQTLIVSSGQTASGLSALSGGTIAIQAGGKAEATVLSAGGTEVVSSGGIASGTTVQSGAIDIVLSGGVGSGATVSSGGHAYAYGSAVGDTIAVGGVFNVLGSATSTTVQAGGSLVVSSGGVASSGTVLGRQDVLSGGTEIATTVSSGGANTVSSGAVASGTIVLSGGIDVVVNGGVESGTTVSSGGQAFDYGSMTSGTVATGGVLEVIGNATSTTVQAGGSLVVSSGGVASGGTVLGRLDVLSGGTERGVSIGTGGIDRVSSGATASGTIVLSGGTDTVAIGGVESGAIVSSGGQAFDYGSMTSGTVATGGVLDVIGSATSTTVQAGGWLYISSGGATSGGTVLGRQEVLSGGTERGVTIGNGGINGVESCATASGTIVLSGGTDIVASGGVESATTVSSGGQEFDYGSMTSGTVATGGVLDVIGSATSTTVQAGGWLYVSSGGVASSSTVLGRQEVLSGGIARGATVSSGGVNGVESGGTASGTIVRSGGTDIVASGGVESGAIVSSGGQAFDYGSMTSGTVATGGVLEVIGNATSTTVQAGGWEYILAGGVASSSTVFGRQEVLSGGIARGASIGNGAIDGVELGGVASGTIVLSGGTDIVAVGGVESGTIVSSGGQAYDYGSMTSGTVATGGVLDVSGSATNMTLQAGGFLYVLSGGATSGGSVFARQEILSGAVENGATIGNGGVNRIDAGGTESGTTVSNGGTDVVAVGGIGSGTTISAGGEQFVYGSAAGTIVASGGVDLVQAGGTLNGATISGGLLDIRSGGTAGTSQINFTSAGGTLELDDSQHFNGVISGFGVPGGIDLTDINFAGATLGYTNNVNSGVLTITNGSNVATIQVLGQYVQANFNLSNDGHGGVLITDPPVLGTTGSPFLTAHS